ncbi:tol-pal system protein YbgF [Thorsellia kenyensis]|uniref:Cell division coordinator CpoB n=1 Tax=Thorsellia kenyensis TaxID=1549888 RepID=A0ABV6CD28_9GAMM
MKKSKLNFYSKFSLSLLLAIGCSLQVHANTTETKIAELERIATAHSQLFTQLQQQMSANQNEISSLRDEIDQLSYKLNQAVEKQQLLAEQFNQLIPMSQSDNTSVPSASNSSNSESQINNNTAIAQPSSSVELTGNDFNDYNSAVNLALNQQNYQQAAAHFEAFIKKYPTSDYIGNAHYWLGQSYYNLNQKNDAAANFAIVVKNYPDSPKASDSLLKVGLILEEQGETEKAKAIFTEVVNQFPGTDSANKAKAKIQ